MEIILPDEVYKVISKFRGAGFQVYIVGGVTRDLLIKRFCKDWDFTTDAKPEEILKLFPEGVYGNRFGTVVIPQKGTTYDRDRDQSLFDITTMRKEGEYMDSRHPDQVTWTKSIEEDLSRRDFTINAIALELNEKSKPILIDPFSGKSDIDKKIIRAVGEPDTRFKEDALRLMRAVRFSAQLDFEIEKKTFESIKNNALLIKNISWERIRDELFKILGSDNAYKGTVELKNTGLLELILPEVTACFGIVQEGLKHDRVYDIGEHLLLSLKFCPSKDPLVRLSALIHDVGKVQTFKKDDDGNVTFYGHEIAGANLSKKIAERLRLSNAEGEKLYRLVRFHMFTVSETQTDSAVRRFIKNVGLENIEAILALRVADRLGGGTATETSWRMEEFKKRIKEVLKKPFSISDLKVTGTDVMEILQIKPGPKVGEILNSLFKEVLEDSEKNKREYLLTRIKHLE